MSNSVCVFIDVNNQFYCVNKRWPGRKLNYERYMTKCKTFGDVVRSLAYGTQIDDAAVNFITALYHLGFEPQYKRIKENSWFSWDVGMAMDMIRLHEKADVIIMGNSNRNMAPAISWLKEKGVRIIVMGCGISKDLKEVCDQWIELTEDMLEDEDGGNKEPEESETPEAA